MFPQELIGIVERRGQTAQRLGEGGDQTDMARIVVEPDVGAAADFTQSGGETLAVAGPDRVVGCVVALSLRGRNMSLSVSLFSGRKSQGPARPTAAATVSQTPFPDAASQRGSSASIAAI